MNNLVESLRYFALPLAGETRKPPNADLLRAAADEIERLRSNLDACGACMKRADAEIERLRELLRKRQDVLNQVAETTLAADVMYEDINKAIGRDALGDT